MMPPAPPLPCDPERLDARALTRRRLLTASLLPAPTLARLEREGLPLEQQIIHHAPHLDEPLWLAAAAAWSLERPDLAVLPVTPTLPPHAPPYDILAQLGLALLLQSDPFPVLATLFPESSEAIRRHLGAQLDPTWQQILISPHAFRAALKAPRHGPPPSPPLDLPTWCAQLGFDPDTIDHPHALVRALWLDESCPVLPSAWLATLPPPEPRAPLGAYVGVLAQAQRHIWIVTDRPLSTPLRDWICHHFRGREPHVWAIPPQPQRSAPPGPAPLESHTSPAPGTANSQPSIGLAEAPASVTRWSATSSDSLFHEILEAAARAGASDVVFRPRADRVQVTFTLGGLDYHQAPLDPDTFARLLSRVKAKGDRTLRTETGVQYASLQAALADGLYHLRVSLMPLVSDRERLAIRLFSPHITQLGQTGLDPDTRATLDWGLTQNNGLILFTGPMNSGKSTLLYAALQWLDAHTAGHRSIVTLEDPVEKRCDTFDQVEINDAAGLGWAAALAAALRQNAQILMIGEIRDHPAAHIACRAALTGHLVLSTLHAHDAVGAVMQLEEGLRIPRAVVGEALKLVLNLRLLPRLCPICRHVRPAASRDLAPLPEIHTHTPRVGAARGCIACAGTGYRGRVLLAESFPIDPVARTFLLDNAPLHRIRAHNRAEGHAPLDDSAAHLFLTAEIDAPTLARFLPHLPPRLRVSA